jgi:hypothetical protein
MSIQFEVKEICCIQDLQSNQYNVVFNYLDQKVSCFFFSESNNPNIKSTSAFSENLLLKNKLDKDIKITIKVYNKYYPKDELKGDLIIPNSFLSSKVKDIKEKYSSSEYSKWINLTNNSKIKNIKGVVKINVNIIYSKNVTEGLNNSDMNINKSLTSSNNDVYNVKSLTKPKTKERTSSLPNALSNELKNDLLGEVDPYLENIHQINQDPFIKDINLTSSEMQDLQRKESVCSYSDKVIKLSLNYEEENLRELSEQEYAIRIILKDYLSTYNNEDCYKKLPTDELYLKLEAASIVDKAIDFYSSIIVISKGFIELHNRLKELNKNLQIDNSKAKMKVKRIQKQIKENNKVNNLSFNNYDGVFDSLNNIMNHPSLDKNKTLLNNSVIENQQNIVLNLYSILAKIDLDKKLIKTKVFNDIKTKLSLFANNEKIKAQSLKESIDKEFKNLGLHVEIKIIEELSNTYSIDGNKVKVVDNKGNIESKYI